MIEEQRRIDEQQRRTASNGYMTMQDNVKRRTTTIG